MRTGMGLLYQVGPEVASCKEQLDTLQALLGLFTSVGIHVSLQGTKLREKLVTLWALIGLLTSVSLNVSLQVT